MKFAKFVIIFLLPFSLNAYAGGISSLNSTRPSVVSMVHAAATLVLDLGGGADG